MKKRIYYHDTDCGGVVYYANYLKYMEEARTEFLEQRRIFINELASSGILFVVARQEIDYKAPAHYGDILEISTDLLEISPVKLAFSHTVRNQEDKLICQGKAVLVCVDEQIRPRPLPQDLRDQLISG